MTLALLALVMIAPTTARAGEFDGEWRTSFGVVTLTQAGDQISGTYGTAGECTVKGSALGKKFTFEYREGKTSGDAQWTLDETGNAFSGGYKSRDGGTGEWNGWRAEAKAVEG